MGALRRFPTSRRGPPQRPFRRQRPVAGMDHDFRQSSPVTSGTSPGGGGTAALRHWENGS